MVAQMSNLGKLNSVFEMEIPNCSLLPLCAIQCIPGAKEGTELTETVQYNNVNTYR